MIDFKTFSITRQSTIPTLYLSVRWNRLADMQLFHCQVLPRSTRVFSAKCQPATRKYRPLHFMRVNETPAWNVINHTPILKIKITQEAKII